MMNNMNKTKKTYAKPGIVLNSEDIFEQLKKSLGCTYISDMKMEPYCSEAKALLKTMDIEEFSLRELNDISCYLYGMQFANKEQALCFLKS